MCRSPSPLATALAVTGALAAYAAGAPAAAARSDRPVRADVRELTLPVLDLALETASLDNGVRRVESAKDVRVTLDTDLLFAFDRARLSQRAAARIGDAVSEIERLDPDVVSVQGHTDGKGPDAYNLRLSRRRAEAVRAALARALDDDPPRLRASGSGENEPVAANRRPDGSDSPKGRARNRRVEIRIPKG